MVCHCREKLDTEEGPTREEIDFVDIAFPPVCAATSVGIHSSELITAPAPARRIVITLPTRLLASRFFPSQIDPLTRGQVTHYLDIVSFAIRYKKAGESFSIAFFSGIYKLRREKCFPSKISRC